MRIIFIFIIALSAVFLLLFGVVLGYLLNWRVIRRLKRKLREPQKLPVEECEKKSETTKRAIWFCLGNGVAWVWCSYILAYLDHPQIAESLSQVAVTEIIGVVLAYCIKSAVENLSKYNRWPDKPAGLEAEQNEPPDAGI